VAKHKKLPMNERSAEKARVVRSSPRETCLHGRLIEDVPRKDGKRTGKVRCAECGAEIEDPYGRVK
jgi:hypothetical protein